MTNLLLITDGYPLGAVTEPAFVEPEIELLAQKFDHTTIIPSVRLGSDNRQISFPPNVTIDTSWVDSPQWQHRWRRGHYLFTPKLWNCCHGDYTRSGLAFGACAFAFARHIEKWMKSTGWAWSDTLFYTFWFDAPTAGLALLKQRHPDMTIISRGHNHDVYTHRGGRLRQLMLESLKYFYSVSPDVTDYMQNEYPNFANKVKYLPLGTPNAPQRTARHTTAEHRITILSVARHVPIKRMGLAARLVKGVALSRPQWSVNWIIVGSGSDSEAIDRELASLPTADNLTIDRMGALEHTDVEALYNTRSIDWLLLSSQREGLPICVCEALSHGVPVIITDGPGLTTAVDDSCALILAHDPTPEELAMSIGPYIDSPERSASISLGAIDFWNKHYNAEILRKQFVDSLP